MSSEFSPLISIVVCTYNGEKHLKEQLDSLVNQTYRNLEIIVVDDCSNDSTIQIIREYESNFSFVKLYENGSNLGYVKNFEKGILLCKGEFILLSDQDDIWDLNKVSCMYEYIGDNLLLYHDSEFIEEDGARMNKKMSERMNFYHGSNGLPFTLYNCVSGHTMMFKRDLIKLALPFDTRFFHDWWLVYVAASKGKINFVNKTLVKYRQHIKSTIDMLELKPIKKQDEHLLMSKLDWIKKCAELNSPYQQYLHKLSILLDGNKNYWNKIKLYLHVRKAAPALMFIRKDTHKHNFKVLKKSVFNI